MSHVEKIDVEINDLEALKKCVEHFGGQFNEGKKTYKWFGTHVGDYPIPKGFTKEDMGKCDHTISVPGNNKAYEVGIVKRKDGEGYQLLWDFFSGGYGLRDMIGENGGKLKQAYVIECSASEAERQGYFVERFRTLESGKMRVEIELR